MSGNKNDAEKLKILIATLQKYFDQAKPSAKKAQLSKD